MNDEMNQQAEEYADKKVNGWIKGVQPGHVALITLICSAFLFQIALGLAGILLEDAAWIIVIMSLLSAFLVGYALTYIQRHWSQAYHSELERLKRDIDNGEQLDDEV